MRMLWRFVLSVVLLVTLTQASPLQKRSVENRSNGLTPAVSKESGYPLPKNVQPNSYRIELELQLVGNNFAFNGESNINVIINQLATKTIILHAADLEIEKEFTSLVTIDGRTTLKPTKQSLDTVKEFLTIEFADAIAAGAYTLNLRYIGKLKEEPQGFYRIQRQINGQYVWEVLTQFKTSNARRAFPCFDEKAMTAFFSIWIKLPENYVANSTALTVRHTAGDKTWYHLLSSGLVSTDDIDFKVVYFVEWDPTPTTARSYTGSTSYPTPPSYTTTPSHTTSSAIPTNPSPIPPTNQKCIHATYLFMCSQCRPVINMSLS